VAPSPEALAEAALRAELHRRERAAFERAAAELRWAVRDDPDLSDLARQLVVEQVPEGLRIQILDAAGQPMFATGGAVPNERARLLLQKVAQVTARLPNALAIAGHTDALPFRVGDGRYGNWELSADRANAARRLLLEGGIAEARLQSVTGHADRTPLLPAEPSAAANRRVAITLLRQAPAPDAPAAAAPLAATPAAIAPLAAAPATPAPAAPPAAAPQRRVYAPLPAGAGAGSADGNGTTATPAGYAAPRRASAVPAPDGAPAAPSASGAALQRRAFAPAAPPSGVGPASPDGWAAAAAAAPAGHGYGGAPARRAAPAPAPASSEYYPR
jgi:outer membrane protein OmpA-like peptidoglycan-associated protein